VTADDAHRDSAPTPSRPPAQAVMPEYKGGELDAERGPGLGCFWFQVVLLVLFIVLTPVSVELGWPPEVSAILLFIVLGLLLFVGQTIIFLLRIVAAERRGRRRPLASGTRTVGEIEESAEVGSAPAGGTVAPSAAAPATAAEPSGTPDPDPIGPASPPAPGTVELPAPAVDGTDASVPGGPDGPTTPEAGGGVRQ
jgi:hypothetical protein